MSEQRMMTAEPVDIDLLDYIRIIAKRKVLIIAATLVCLIIAIVATRQITPVYEASAELLVSQGQMVVDQPSGYGDAYQAVIMSEKLANTFSKMLTGRTVVERAIKELKLSATPADLADKISAEPVKDTQLIKITVKDTNPRQAKQLANTLGEVFSKMEKKLETSPSKSATDIRLVEPAVQPTSPVQPKPALNAIIAVLIGLIASIGLAFLIERLDVSVKSTEDIEKLTGVTSLGQIPFTNVKNIVVDSDPHSLVSEAYRSVRTNIQYLNFDQSAKVILVTSPGAKEGKTTLSTNLATVLAQGGNKVLAIDCDLRRPMVHQMFDLSNDVGLANILIGKSDITLAMQQGPVEGLGIITSGPVPPNPADLLGSERMENLLNNAREIFDFIILDSPPNLAVTDAAVLASQIDGVLLASIFGRTNKHALATAKTELEKINARTLGFVINGVKLQKGYGYNYDYYYHKEYSESDKRVGTRKTLAKSTLITFLVILTVLGCTALVFIATLAH